MQFSGRKNTEKQYDIFSSSPSLRIILNLYGVMRDSLAISMITGYPREDVDGIIRILVDYCIVDTDGGYFGLSSLGKAFHSIIKETILSFGNSATPKDGEKLPGDKYSLIDIFERNEQEITSILCGDDLSIKNMPDKSGLLENLSRYHRFVDFITENYEYLNVHRLDILPVFAINSLYKLTPAGLYYDPTVNFKQNFDFYLDILMKAKRIRGVSTWAQPVIAEALVKIVQSGVPVELVITPELALTLLKEKPYRDLSEKVMDIPYISIRVAQCRIATGLTVTDKFLSVGFFLNDGLTYDSVFDFISSSTDSIEWGEELFRYYHGDSMAIEDFIRMQIL